MKSSTTQKLKTTGILVIEEAIENSNIGSHKWGIEQWKIAAKLKTLFTK